MKTSRTERDTVLVRGNWNHLKLISHQRNSKSKPRTVPSQLLKAAPWCRGCACSLPAQSWRRYEALHARLTATCQVNTQSSKTHLKAFLFSPPEAVETFTNMNATNVSCYYAKDTELNTLLVLDKMFLLKNVLSNRKKTFNFQKTEICK